MQNWIGIGIWIVMGSVIGLAMKAIVKRPEQTPGHTRITAAPGAFAPVNGEWTVLYVTARRLSVLAASTLRNISNSFALSLCCSYIGTPPCTRSRAYARACL